MEHAAPPCGECASLPAAAAGGKPAGEAKRWLDGDSSNIDTTSHCTESQPTAGSHGSISGPDELRARTAVHPWDAFFDAAPPPPREGGQQELAYDRVFVERSDRGRVEWRPGAGGGMCPLHDERISHCLGRILRYHTEACGLQEDEDGYVSLAALTSTVPDFEGVTEEDIRRVIRESIGPRGPRFELREKEAREPEVRALYKHPKDRGRHGGIGWGFAGRSGMFGRGRLWPPLNDAAYCYNGVRPRTGFSKPPPDQDNGAMEVVTTASKPASGQRSADVESLLETEEVATTASKAASGQHSTDMDSLPETEEVGPATASSSSQGTRQPNEIWDRYYEPGTQRVWFWNEASNEMFYADDTGSGWQRFLDAKSKAWWWHGASERYFYEEDAE